MLCAVPTSGREADRSKRGFGDASSTGRARHDARRRVLEGSYSPDGTSIVLETSHGATGGQFPDVYVMNVDGTNMRPLTRTRNFETEADWGPVAEG